MQNQEPRSERGRNQGERIGALEQDMAVVKNNIRQLQEQHNESPGRIIRLEQQFAHQSDKLDDLEVGMERVNSTIEKMGTKITWALGAVAGGMILVDKLWPVISKGLGV
jgi:uncharacterized coiled-coil protein SlyX